MAEGPTHSLARLGNELAGQARQYARLMRLDQPVGIWLLLWPTLWGLWIAAEGRPAPVNFIVFVAGVIVMRSAGCVINDYADRGLDGAVARTRSRPLAAGLVAPMEALALFAVLGLVALALLMMPNPLARMLAVGAAVLTIVYPFSKRWLAAPQFLLGAAFGWGIPMAFAVETGIVPRLAWLQCAARSAHPGGAGQEDGRERAQPGRAASGDDLGTAAQKGISHRHRAVRALRGQGADHRQRGGPRSHRADPCAPGANKTGEGLSG